MGLEDPGPPATYYCVNSLDPNTPIDFFVIVSSLGVSSPYRTYAWFYGCGQGEWGTIEYLEVNGQDVGALSFQEEDPEGCGTWYALIPNDWVNVGADEAGRNLFMIGLTAPESDENCLAVHEGGLYLEEEEEEFVPEASTIILLGSGLTSLAAYATVAWRARRKEA